MKGWSLDRVLLVVSLVFLTGMLVYIFVISRKYERSLDIIMENNEEQLRELEEAKKTIILDMEGLRPVLDSLRYEKEKIDKEIQMRPDPSDLEPNDAELYFARRYGEYIEADR